MQNGKVAAGKKDYPPFYRRFIFPLCRKRIHSVKGLDRLPESGPFIIAANHVGSFDPPMIVSIINPKIHELLYFVTEQYLVNILGIRRAVHSLGMIPKIERTKNSCLDLAREHLAQGNIVGIFPEGMRNDGPNLLKGKTGVARLALWSKAPVVPVGYLGPGTWSIRQATKYFIRGMNPKIEIVFGEPMTFADHYDKPITYEILRDVTKRIMLAISPLANKPYPY